MPFDQVHDPRVEQAKQLNDAAMRFSAEDRHATALSMLRRASALAPDLDEVHGNIGLVAWRMGDHATARAELEHAAWVAPDKQTHRGNLGVFLQAAGEFAEAERQLAMAAYLAGSGGLSAQWDLALLRLADGRWAEGLEGYETRIALRGAPLYPNMPCAPWRGEDLAGKTLFVAGEQGIGDHILFSRYLAWLKDAWPDCRILTCFNPALVPLFWDFRDLATFLPSGTPFPDDADYGVFLGSLPLHHGSRPDRVPPDPGLIAARVRAECARSPYPLPEPHLPSLKIGIAWTGNPAQQRNGERSIPLEMFFPLMEDPRVQLYALQCSPGSDDVALHRAADLVYPLGPALERDGWIATGRAMLGMDLIVTVCTSTAHLAGALGVPVRALLCSEPYWVWGREGEETPWYPGMRLIRQQRPGDWSPVMETVQREITALADARFGKA